MTTDIEGQLSCEEVVRLLWDYLDSELDDDRRLRVHEHLAECEHCAGQFTFEGAFLRAIGSLIDEPLDVTGLRGRVLARLEAHGYDGRRLE
jgi:anti-sigma factor (TIGR02949 family)